MGIGPVNHFDKKKVPHGVRSDRHPTFTYSAVAR